MLLPHWLTEVTGPLLGDDLITSSDADLTGQHDGEPQGQRIIVAGRVLDSDGRPVPDTLIEIWQTNAAGRYRTRASTTRRRSTRTSTASAAASPTRAAGTASSPSSRVPTRGETTATPGARRTSISRLFGRAFTQRLVTQMYFQGDPLLPLDPIYNSVPDEKARQRMVAGLDMDLTQPEWALGYPWDIVLRGRSATAFDERGATHDRG